VSEQVARNGRPGAQGHAFAFFGQVEEAGAFQSAVIRLMEDQLELAFEGAKEHAMAAVAIEQRFRVMRPVSIDEPVIGAGEAQGVAVGAEAGPEHQQSASGGAM
jgi:hypothetical protein